MHLTVAKDVVTAKLVLYEAVWSKESTELTFKRHEFGVPDAKGVRTKLDAYAAERLKAGKSLTPPVLLVFSDPTITYGEVMAFVRPALSTHGTVYFFVEK